MRAVNLLIKPASSACNLSCKYCFYHSLSEKRSQFFKGMMDTETAERVVEQAFLSGPETIGFAFQGGEPMLAGLDFYRRFTEACAVWRKKRPEVCVRFSLQTNAVLINDEWCRFLKENEFLVGVSLDGYSGLHDYFRIGPRQKGSFSAVMNAVKLLDKSGVEYNILSVITNNLAAHTQKVYNFFRKNQFRYLQFIPCLSEFGEDDSEYALTQENYAKFLTELFDLWLLDYRRGRPVSVRHIDNLMLQLAGQAPELCGAGGKCTLQFVVEGDGSVYPCDFYCTDAYRLGNIAEASLTELAGTDTAQRFLKRSERPGECYACAFRSLCDSGCKRHYVAAADNRGVKNRYCAAYKQYFAYAVPQLKALLRQADSTKPRWMVEETRGASGATEGKR